MATLAEQMENARIRAGEAITARDKETALQALNEFIHLGIQEIEFDHAMDEADDYYYDNLNYDD